MILRTPKWSISHFKIPENSEIEIVARKVCFFLSFRFHWRALASIGKSLFPTLQLFSTLILDIPLPIEPEKEPIYIDPLNSYHAL